MRSPGCSRISQTRTRSFSDSSLVPTQGFGLAFSRSNSAAISGGHAAFSQRSALFSVILRAIAVPPHDAPALYSNFPHVEKLMANPGGKQGRAIIVGGSMSGLLAGLMLLPRGWDVEIFERVESELSGRGAGIV